MPRQLVTNAQRRSQERPFCVQARDRLKSIVCYSNSDEEDATSFYPGRYIKTLFIPNNVEKILSCSCSRCAHHARVLRRDGRNLREISEWVHSGTAGNEQLSRGGARSLFGLLVHIDAAMLILEFFDLRRDDRDILGSLCRGLKPPNEDTIADQWPLFQRSYPDESQIIAKDFRRQMYRFWPPVISDQSFEQYPSGMVMPFVKETRLDKGVSAKVFGFSFYKGYVHLQGYTDEGKYARKEFIDDTEIKAFFSETRNLGLVSKLADDHIVKIVKCYRKGKIFNIIFPRAECNLYNCLIGEKAFIDGLVCHPLPFSRMWDEMLGLARALDRIINFDGQLDDGKDVFRTLSRDQPLILGYHFDLKPANILVYLEQDTVTLKISDFGQAKFKSHGENTQTIAHGGTPTYAAPESVTDHGGRINTRYDIWSLGCIFLEIITFMLKGSEGVRQFTAHREQRTANGHGRDSMFYYRQADGEVVLRKSVADQISDLLPIREPGTSRLDDENLFWNRIRDLILGMLQPDKEKRLSSTEVFQNLGQAIKDSREVVSPHGDDYNQMQTAPSGDVLSSDGVTLSSLLDRFLSREIANREQDFKPCVLEAYKVGKKLKLIATCHQQVYADTEALSNIFIVPRYLFYKSYEHFPGPGRQPNFWFFSTDNNNESGKIKFGTADAPFGYFEYRGQSLECNQFMQSLLSSQDIRQSCHLQKFTYELAAEGLHENGRRLFQDFRHRIRHRENEREERVPSASLMGHEVFSVQLWRERKDLPPISNEDLQVTSSYRAPRPPESSTEPVRSRIVIFTDNSLVVVPFSEFMREKKIQSEESGRKSIEFELTENGKLHHSHITGFRLAVPSKDARHPSRGYPAIPLDPETLKQCENASGNPLRMKTFKLHFASEQQTKNFHKAYIDLKNIWTREYLASHDIRGSYSTSERI